MRFGTLGMLLIVVSIGLTLCTASEGAEQKFLNRSIYLPVTFVVCEHLGDAFYCESEQLVSSVPASRVFQFRTTRIWRSYYQPQCRSAWKANTGTQTSPS